MPYGFNDPGFICLFKLLIARDIIASRLVDKQQVDIIRAEPLERFLHSAVVLINRGPKLCAEEDILPFYARFFHSPAHCLFVYIGIGGVHKAVTVFERGIHRIFRLIGRKQKCADTNGRYFYTV